MVVWIFMLFIVRSSRIFDYAWGAFGAFVIFFVWAISISIKHQSFLLLSFNVVIRIFNESVHLFWVFFFCIVLLPIVWFFYKQKVTLADIENVIKLGILFIALKRLFFKMLVVWAYHRANHTNRWFYSSHNDVWYQWWLHGSQAAC